MEISREDKLAQLENYPYDIITTRSGREIRIFFFKHASLAFLVGDKVVYVDPVDAFADYEALPKADLILVTHSHSDHLDTAAIGKTLDYKTMIIADRTSAAMLSEAGFEAQVAAPAERISFEGDLDIDVVAAYNTTEEHLKFHPRDRGDCGYVLNIDGARIYLSGDSEPTPEMEALENIDIAFLSVNQPYTMTVEQATSVVKKLRPAIFYPYHYGGIELSIKTNIAQLCYNLEGVTEVRIRPLD